MRTFAISVGFFYPSGVRPVVYPSAVARAANMRRKTRRPPPPPPLLLLRVFALLSLAAVVQPQQAGKTIYDRETFHVPQPATLRGVGLDGVDDDERARATTGFPWFLPALCSRSNGRGSARRICFFLPPPLSSGPSPVRDAFGNYYHCTGWPQTKIPSIFTCRFFQNESPAIIFCSNFKVLLSPYIIFRALLGWPIISVR